MKSKAILKCVLCGQKFKYEKKYIKDSNPEHPYPEDYSVDCPMCGNWEEVGNDSPQSFDIIEEF